MTDSDGDLMARLRAMRERRAPSGADTPTEPPAQSAPPPRAYDFSRLPEFEQMRLQRAAADMAGFDPPFFREHTIVDGPVSTINGVRQINFSSYDYLGLNAHPDVRAAAQAAIAEWGISATASRVVGGERPYHAALEAAIADLYGVESAITMVSGHATNVTTLGALLGPRDLILTDTLIHNSITEGCRLAGARRVVFPHNDVDWIDDHLTRHRDRYDNVLIVVEGLYSMDGDMPDLAALVALKSRHRAWLMVDEAHSLGVLGASGRGLAELTGVDPQSVEIWMGTLSKTCASCGGYIAGSKALIDYLKYKAAGFVFSVGLAAPLAAAALASLTVMRQEPERVARLRANGLRFRQKAEDAGLDVGLSEGYAVAPIIIGSSLQAATVSDQVYKAGINALPIIYPAVPEKSARLRFFVTSEHDETMIDDAIAAVSAANKA